MKLNLLLFILFGTFFSGLVSFSLKAQTTKDCLDRIEIMLDAYSSYEVLALIDSCSKGVKDEEVKKDLLFQKHFLRCY
jgi:hypothetical protein